MNTYHFCYVIGDDLCTGVNIKSSSYLGALQKFNNKHGNRDLLYVMVLPLARRYDRQRYMVYYNCIMVNEYNICCINVLHDILFYCRWY